MSLEPEEILAVAVPAAIALLGLMVGLLVSRSVVSRLAKTAEQTRSVAGNVVVAAVRGPLVLWFFIAGLYAAVQVTDLPPNIAALIQKLLLALMILSVSWALARIVGALVEAVAWEFHRGLSSAGAGLFRWNGVSVTSAWVKLSLKVWGGGGMRWWIWR